MMARMPARGTQEVTINCLSYLLDSLLLGPLVTAEPGGYYSQIGVVSWGYGCADPDFPGVYARVTAVNSFIQDRMIGQTCPPPPMRMARPLFYP